MGCGCHRKKRIDKQIQKINTNLIIKIQNRYTICNKCSKAIPVIRQVIDVKRNKIKKKCKKLNIDISLVSSNFNYKCPLNKF